MTLLLEEDRVLLLSTSPGEGVLPLVKRRIDFVHNLYSMNMVY